MRTRESIILAALVLAQSTLCGGGMVQLSGIYPHLAFFNDEGECGTGAVVPWAGSLWAVTYGPHLPNGSSDKLYRITPDLQLEVRPESIGGTPANRMIHEESGQLLIGPHLISKDGKVRTIPYTAMFGRHTGTARHLTDPQGKAVYATMEEGIYEVDLKTLKVRELWGDEASKNSARKADLPGYHGKGFYSGQGVYVYSNNGEHGSAALRDPEVPSGVLAEWDGAADRWTIVRRNQFTEVTGPGGIKGNANPATDPIWALGWDAKSLLLGVRMPASGWSFHRLPKSSHSYDGAHGWNTEWPRIRDIGEKDLLMTMHGSFWRFPRDFRPGQTGGIAPRSNYLKVIGDFCRWNDRLVFGCDDTAKAEFLNKRKAKGEVAAPQSQSNLWFVDPAALDQLGPVLGRGAVWLHEEVAAGAVSDPMLVNGYARVALHLACRPGDGTAAPLLAIEADADGSGTWRKVREVPLRDSYQWIDLSGLLPSTWLRLRTDRPLAGATAWFHLANPDSRGTANDALFSGLADARQSESLAGLVRARDNNRRTLVLAANDTAGKPAGAYELTAGLELVPSTEPGLLEHTMQSARIPGDVLKVEAGSVLYVDDKGHRWRLPPGDPLLAGPNAQGPHRIAREVATERDLFHAQGTFYELPAENAGGFAKVRPVATHNLRVHDFCSYRGLLILTGIDPAGASAGKANPHVIRSADGKAAVWAGAVDDIWKMGKPRGTGGPWHQSSVKAGVPSDPYLMTGFDRKSLRLEADKQVEVTVEVDITGSGHWVPYRTFTVTDPVEHQFPAAFQAYWVRFTAAADAVITGTLRYD